MNCIANNRRKLPQKDHCHSKHFQRKIKGVLREGTMFSLKHPWDALFQGLFHIVPTQKESYVHNFILQSTFKSSTSFDFPIRCQSR